MRRFTTIGVLAVMLAGCTSSTSGMASPIPAAPIVAKATSNNPLAFMHRQILTNRIDSMLTALRHRVGKTWYVFSGATPAGWDCSGLVMWGYEQIGVELPHSANKQAHIGKRVKTGQPGDIVVFGYKGTDTYFHAGIYLGGNKFIHAGFRKGTRTSILSLTDPSVVNTKIRFVRLLPALPIG